MKKSIIYALLSACLVFFSGFASAADGASEHKVIPAEAYGCKFNAGKTMADLDKVSKSWNAWMDQNGDGTYGAWTMTPHHFDEAAFDVVWVGSWTDGAAMGKGKDAYASKGGAIAAEFAKVVTCNMHSEFMEENVREGNPDADYKTMVATFWNCSVVDGKTMADVYKTNDAWNALLDKIGSQASTYFWHLGLGNDTADYDFKWIQIDPDWASVGHDWEKLENGPDSGKVSPIFDGTIDCDKGRTYDLKEVRTYAAQ